MIDYTGIEKILKKVITNAAYKTLEDSYKEPKLVSALNYYKNFKIEIEKTRYNNQNFAEYLNSLGEGITKDIISRWWSFTKKFTPIKVAGKNTIFTISTKIMHKVFIAYLLNNSHYSSLVLDGPRNEIIDKELSTLLLPEKVIYYRNKPRYRKSYISGGKRALKRSNLYAILSTLRDTPKRQYQVEEVMDLSRYTIKLALNTLVDRGLVKIEKENKRKGLPHILYIITSSGLDKLDKISSI